MAAIQRFYIKQNDTRPTLRCILLDANELPVDLTAAALEFHMRAYPGGTTKISAGSVTVLNAGRGDIEYQWSSSDTDTAETYEAEFEVTYSNGTIQTFPNDKHAFVYVTDDIA
jgi:hypothetical protein